MGGSSNQADESSGDFLGYSVYAQTLWARVVRALNKDASGLDATGRKTRLGDDPLVVGIFGEWGAGKSKLLSLVMEQAEHQSARDISERILGSTSGNPMTVTVPVYFQPWKYEHERHLHVPLAVHVAEALRETWDKLPTDIEKLKRTLTNAGETLEKATELAENAREKIEKAKGFFDGALGALQSRAGAVVAGTTDVMLTSVGAPPLISVARKKILNVFGRSAGGESNEADATEPEDVEEGGEVEDEGSGEGTRSKPAKSDAKSDKPVTKPVDPWAWRDDGLGFYQLHKRLQALTRPKLNKKLLDGAGIKVTENIEFDLRINFVIFVDDLDRCLPEKAVETLELIKTVFNLESFAFVLALDEEVVERGIGHRYKDYALANKKPEMPITGFEYLEKIVHLPFRLPGLTRLQARRFLERYEADEVAPDTPEQWWFSPRSEVAASHNKEVMGESDRQTLERLQAPAAELSDLVLSAFTAYVPRKLVRLVELLHQVQHVALRRSKSLTVDGVDGTDVRVVTALVMLQLFQPDLYRLVRRKPQAFPLLLAAFATRTNAFREIADPVISDVDLWLWVVDESAGEDNGWIQTSDISRAMDSVILRIAKKYHVVTDQGVPVRYQDRTTNGEEVTVTEYDTAKTREQRSRALNVKLPLVAQIVEHRATQRHAFDPLRLFHALAGALENGWDSNQSKSVSPASEVKISDYFELMVGKDSAEQPQRRVVTATVSGAWSVQAPITTQRVRFLDRLFADLTSDQPEVQANLVANNELEAGKPFDLKGANGLLEMAKGWRSVRPSGEDRVLLTRGLRVIAPFVPRELGRDFLALIDDQRSAPFFVQGNSGAFDSVDRLLNEVDRADLWSALGQDDRFDPARLHLPKLRWPTHSSDEEPIAGFVRVPKGPFTLGAEGQRFVDNPPNRNASIASDFYIARYLTTVDQFAHFVAAQGYGDPSGEKLGWWDSLGWLWRTGQWDAQVKEEGYREHLSRRRPELRGAPVQWNEQLAHGSRPVMGLNWFEARAYARWLTLQLKDELDRLPPGYAVQLPTELQWERAARAKDAASADTRQYPWGGADEKTAHLHANISVSGFGRVSPVGLFAPNPLGLFDLSGNLWEWQSNLYGPDGRGQGKALGYDVSKLEPNDRPALRGGAWGFTAVDARASIRNWDPPDGSNGYVGFRVVLSLASQTPET